MTPANGSPSRSSAMEMQKWGIPWRKLVVPSSGSMTQRFEVSVPTTTPLSSINRPYAGRALVNSRCSTDSAFLSALLTKSAGPFLET